MIAAFAAATLSCALNLPLPAGAAPSQREVGMIKVPLEQSMLDSMRSGTPPLLQTRFVGEGGELREWIIASRAKDGSATIQMLRLIPTNDPFQPFAARFGAVTEDGEKLLRFAERGEGRCTVVMSETPKGAMK